MNKFFPFVVLVLVGCSNQNTTFTKQPVYPQTEEEVEGWGTCEGWSFRDHWTYRFGKMNWRQQETSKKE